MKAIVQDRYGPPGVLALWAIDAPGIGADDAWRWAQCCDAATSGPAPLPTHKGD